MKILGIMTFILMVSVSLWKVNSKSKLQLEENEFLEHTACFVAAFNQLRHQKQQEYLDEMRDQRKEVPEMTDYPVQRALDSLSKSSLQAELQLLKRRAVMSEVGMEKLYPFAREIFYSKHPRFPREEIRQVFLRLDPALIINPGGKIVEQWVGYGKGVLKNKMAKYLN